MDSSKVLYTNLVEKGVRHGIQVGKTDCICSKCREYGKKGKSPTKRVKNIVQCCLHNFEFCSSQATSYEYVSNSDTFRNIFFDSDDQRPTDLDCSQKLPFCKRHFMLCYNYKNNLNCECCDRVLRGNTDKRYLINIDLGTAVCRLKVVHDDVNVTEDSILCRTCYMLVMRPRVHKSLEDVLLSLNHVDKKEIGSSNELVHESVLNNVCKDLCKAFSEDRALLFIDIYENYSTAVVEYYIKQGRPSDVTSDPKPRRWLLAGLRRKSGNLLEEHCTSATNMSKMLTYKHADVKKILHKLLFQRRWEKGDNDKADNMSDSFDIQNSSHDSTLYCAGIDFNQRLREQASKVNEYYKEKVNRLDLRNVDFEYLLRFIDPRVWNMFTVMSMNSEEKKMLRKNPLSWDEHIRLGNTQSQHVKFRFVLRVFLIFMLHFVMNNDNQYPFHMIHANIIKRFSNSSKLVMACNRLGFCASEKALQGFLNLVNNNKKPLSALNEKSFTLVSVDNIDSLSPYAAVTADEAGRSWHGTSVMGQQPLPDSQILGVGEVLNLECIKIFEDGRNFYRCLAAWSQKKIIVLFS